MPPKGWESHRGRRNGDGCRGDAYRHHVNGDGAALAELPRGQSSRAADGTVLPRHLPIRGKDG